MHNYLYPEMYMLRVLGSLEYLFHYVFKIYSCSILRFENPANFPDVLVTPFPNLLM